MYIVTDPSLAAAVQRASKTMSFSPLVPDITQRVLGMDGDTVAIVRQHIDPEPGEPRGFLADMHDLVYSSLGPGEALNGLSLDAVRELAKQVDEYVGVLQRGKEGEDEVDLLRWIRHFVAIATANLLYGDENPLVLHPELEAAFWDFDHGLGALLTGVFPSITARKAYRGREALVRGFEEYLSLDRHVPGEGRKGASPIVRERVAVALRHGWTLRATARSELSFLFAGIVNTATTTFWMVLHIFASASSPDTGNLLSAIRSELTSSLTPGSQTDTLTLSLDKLKTSSPTLQSVLRECLRQNSDTYSTRLVKSPTTLPSKSGPYHLAANAIVQISGGTMHSDPRIWGQDVGEFNPLRFHSLPASTQRGSLHNSRGSDGGSDSGKKKREMQASTPPPSSPTNPTSSSDNTTTTTTSTPTTTPTTTANRPNTNPSNTDPKRTKTDTKPDTNPEKERRTTTHPAAFRAFGGGKTLCPGRHFATLTIQALVALLVTKFDIVGLDGDDDADNDDDKRDNDEARRAATENPGGKGEGEGGSKQRGGGGEGRQGGGKRGRIQVPGKEDGVLPVHVLEPKGVVRVRVRVRESRVVVVV
jgi:cytochrome P450